MTKAKYKTFFLIRFIVTLLLEILVILGAIIGFIPLITFILTGLSNLGVMIVFLMNYRKSK